MALLEAMLSSSRILVTDTAPVPERLSNSTVPASTVPVTVTPPPTVTLPTTFKASKCALLNTFAATAPEPAPLKNTTAVVPAGTS